MRIRAGAKLPKLRKIKVKDLTTEEWSKIEDKFRFYAFSTYYRRTYREEHDLLLRFVKSLVASADPILDKQRVLDWHLRHRKTKQK